MTRENLKNQVNSKIVNDELSEEEMMHDIMQMVDAHVTQRLILSGVVSSFLCEGCGSDNIKERSGYKVCFDCGKGH
jgi:hypothetical protein